MPPIGVTRLVTSSRTFKTKLSAHLLPLTGVLLLVFLSSALVVGLAGSQEGARISKIDFVGLQRVSREDAVAASGLSVGQLADVAALDAAADKLMQSGLFKGLSYNFRVANSAASVTFNVEELKSGTPVVFDNFVWFTDEELTGAIRKNIPSFDGTAPDSGGVTDTITRALEALLRERGIKGQVEYTPSADASGRNPEHVFSVKDARVPVCTLNFTGASAVAESELVRLSSRLLENDYSQKFVAGFVESNLLPVYRERGHLRAAFRAPQVRRAASGGDCQDGVSVSVAVDEGAVYAWDKAVWSGNQGLTNEELDAALGMRRGDVANGVKLDKAADALRKAYGRRGFLAVRVAGVPAFDDAGRRVAYRFDVKEGPQYRMGELTILGLDERDTNNLRGRWRILPREIYDASYIEEFTKKAVTEFFREAAAEGRAVSGQSLKIESGAKPNNERMTVDVTINFKSTGATTTAKPVPRRY